MRPEPDLSATREYERDDRPDVPPAHVEASADPIPSGPAPDLPPLVAELPQHLHGLHESPAPGFPTHGTPLNVRLKRLANKALGLVGLSQRRFNQQVAETLTLMMAETRGLRAWVEERAPLLPSAPDLTAALEALRGEVQSLRLDVRHLRDHVTASREVMDGIDGRVGELRARLDAIAPSGEPLAGADAGGWARHVTAALAALDQRLVQLHVGHDDHGRWFATLQRKYEALSLEARAIVEDRSAIEPEPRIVDPDAYATRIAGMTDGLRVNVGCGEQPWRDYVNVDMRELPDVDIVADVRRLPFEPGSLAELASAHLVEHFREHQLRTRILPYWRSLLRPDGRLRIVCPDWDAMLARLGDGRLPLRDFKTLTFGMQDYEGDDHFAMYTTATLGAALREAGFSEVQVVARDRMNGLCPEMELVARP
jgi:predicted SAM-dependent methyltransferase